MTGLDWAWLQRVWCLNKFYTSMQLSATAAGHTSDSMGKMTGTPSTAEHLCLSIDAFSLFWMCALLPLLPFYFVLDVLCSWRFPGRICAPWQGPRRHPA